MVSKQPRLLGSWRAYRSPFHAVPVFLTSWVGDVPMGQGDRRILSLVSLSMLNLTKAKCCRNIEISAYMNRVLTWSLHRYRCTMAYCLWIDQQKSSNEWFSHAYCHLGRPVALMDVPQYASLVMMIGKLEDHRKVQCKGEEGKVVHRNYQEMQVNKGIHELNMIFTLYLRERISSYRCRSSN